MAFLNFVLPAEFVKFAVLPQTFGSPLQKALDSKLLCFGARQRYSQHCCQPSSGMPEILARWNVGATGCRTSSSLTGPPYWSVQQGTGRHGQHLTCFFLPAGDCDAEAWSRPRVSPPLPPVPHGWSFCSVMLTHSAAGGGTSGRWQLVMWYPPAYPAAFPAPFLPRSWFPIRAYVSDRVAASPVPRGDIPADLPPVECVVRAGGWRRAMPRLAKLKKIIKNSN